MRDLPRSVCSCKPCHPALDTQDFMSGMKASLWGARLMALTSASGCLGAIDLRSACLGWLCQTLCSHARYLDVSTLHTFKIDVISPASSSTRLRTSQFQPRPSSLKTSSCDALFKILLGILEYWISSTWDLFEVGTPAKASLRSALPDSLQLC
jgi:hypothetical protein